MKIKKIITSFLYLFFFVLVISIIALKLFGYPARYDLTPSTPYSWQEIYHSLPHTIITSALISVLGTVFNSQAKKNEEWRINEARKRIAEREKHEKEKEKEKEKESANDDERQEQNIIRSHEEKEPK